MTRKLFASFIIIAFFVGTAGSIFFGHWALPALATVHGFEWVGKLVTSAPIVVQRTQTVQLNEGVNLIDLVKQANNITVGIYSKSGQRLGSGMAVTADGLIFTSTQVITTNSSVKVIVNNGTVYDALVRATDRKSGLAILTITVNNLAVAQFDSAYDLVISQRLIALGEKNSISGYVTSAASSQPNLNQTASSETFSDNLATDIQSSWDIIGGPVIDLNGKVVGLDEGSKIILSDELQTALNSYVKDGKITRAYLGLHYENLPTGLAAIRGFAQAGIEVDSVEKGSPAALAGLLPNDLIVGIDGSDLGKDTLEQILNQHDIAPMQFKVLRAGKEVGLTANLIAK